MNSNDSNLIATGTVREYFHDAFNAASKNQDVSVDDMTSAYVVNLLTTYTHSNTYRSMCDEGTHHRPLASLYADAVATDGAEQRNRMLQQLGDIALFIGGLFTDSLNRKPVDVDYYISMGESAYGSLHESLQQRRDRFARVDLFGELRRQFSVLVDLLTEISEQSGMKSNADVIRTYEVWMRTGSERARRQLTRCGIVPIGEAQTVVPN